MTGWIDRRPTWIRDLLVGLASIIAGWGVTDLGPALDSQGGWLRLAGAILVVGLASVTKWTQAYGRRDSQPEP